jgi:hypothetical protein
MRDPTKLRAFELADQLAAQLAAQLAVSAYTRPESASLLLRVRLR